jgi:hypothetical protein
MASGCGSGFAPVALKDYVAESAMYVAKQPKHNNENQDSGKTAAAKFPCGCAGEQSAKRSFHVLLPAIGCDVTR